MGFGDMTRQDWLWVERRAAKLGIGAPPARNARNARGPYSPYTREEREGWSINFWDYKVRGETESWAKALRRVPRGREQWAGWLAREVFHAIWTG